MNHPPSEAATSEDRWLVPRLDFLAGRIGRSVTLPLAGLTPLAVHEKLIDAGFWPQRFPISAPISSGGRLQWRLIPDGSRDPGPDAPQLAAEIVYVHTDRGVVRMFGGPSGVAALSIGADGVPWCRKAVLAEDPKTRTPTALGLDAEAFVVTEDGKPLPKSPRSAHGLQFALDKAPTSYDLARAVVVGSRIPLKPGPLPSAAFAPGGRGLAKRFTIVPPAGTFWRLAQNLLGVARQFLPLPRHEGGDVRLFFTGDQQVFRKLSREVPRTGLASMCIHRGACVIGVEPFGYEASVEQLMEICQPMLGAAGFRIFDDVTGDDLTLVASRFPERFFGADVAIDRSIDASTV